jgi:arylsulfatase A-like enzyme
VRTFFPSTPFFRCEFADHFRVTAYRGDRGYLPNRRPRAAYADMVTRMDRDIGRLLDLITRLGLEERTIVVFTSDNGPLYDGHGGTDTEFFNSAAGLRGRKGSFYEGGFRVPCLVKWQGRVAAGGTCSRVTGFEDWLPTLLELAGAGDKVPADLDGISFAPTLLDREQAPRPLLYRESPGYGGQQCVRVDDWKAVRRNLHPTPKAKQQRPEEIELYNLATDPAETTDLANDYPEIVAKLRALMLREHEKSALFPLRALDDDL